jgi:hypothetical protein
MHKVTARVPGVGVIPWGLSRVNQLIGCANQVDGLLGLLLGGLWVIQAPDGVWNVTTVSRRV